MFVRFWGFFFLCFSERVESKNILLPPTHPLLARLNGKQTVSETVERTLRKLLLVVSAEAQGGGRGREGRMEVGKAEQWTEQSAER